jgi:hypothetical protein
MSARCGLSRPTGFGVAKLTFCEPQTLDMNVAGWYYDSFIPAAVRLLLLLAAWRTVLRLRPGYSGVRCIGRMIGVD